MSQNSIAILTLSLVSAGAIAANRFVTPGVAQAGNQVNTLGVSRVAAVGAGERIPVDALGTTTIEAGAAVAVGATIQSDANGRGITWAAGAKVAIALEAAGALGDLIEIMLVPNAV